MTPLFQPLEWRCGGVKYCLQDRGKLTDLMAWQPHFVLVALSDAGVWGCSVSMDEIIRFDATASTTVSLGPAFDAVPTILFRQALTAIDEIDHLSRAMDTVYALRQIVQERKEREVGFNSCVDSIMRQHDETLRSLVD